MKKGIKLISLIFALIIMSICFTGCDQLDAMRESQAFWTTDGKYDSVTYNGTVYKQLPTQNPPTPFNEDSATATQAVFVTTSDIPVLLSQSEGIYMDLSADKNFLTSSTYSLSPLTHPNGDYDFLNQTDDTIVFCNEEIYDDVIKQMEDGIEYPMYGYEYWTYDDETGEGKLNFYYLTDEEIEAVNKVIEEVEPVEDDQIAYNCPHIATLQEISENKYFSKISYDIYEGKTNEFYLVLYSNTTDKHIEYKVPQELNDIFVKTTQQSDSLTKTLG